MIRKNYLFGHRIDWSGGVWHFRDTGVGGTLGDRVCPKCGLKRTAEGYDPCIAGLPGVKSACCGHGVEPGYVRFVDDRVLRGVFGQCIN